MFGADLLYVVAPIISMVLCLVLACNNFISVFFLFCDYLLEEERHGCFNIIAVLLIFGCPYSLTFSCLVFLVLSRLLIAALWSPAGKGLTSWFSLVMFIVFLLVSHVKLYFFLVVLWSDIVFS